MSHSTEFPNGERANILTRYILKFTNQLRPQLPSFFLSSDLFPHDKISQHIFPWLSICATYALPFPFNSTTPALNCTFFSYLAFFQDWCPKFILLLFQDIITMFLESSDMKFIPYYNSSHPYSVTEDLFTHPNSRLYPVCNLIIHFIWPPFTH